jgi:transcription initiation factor IIE alpha subunit
MNNTQITIIKQVTNGPIEKDTLKEHLSIKDRQIRKNIIELYYAGYIIFEDKKIRLSDTSKGILLKTISKDFDIAKILKD